MLWAEKRWMGVFLPKFHTNTAHIYITRMQWGTLIRWKIGGKRAENRWNSAQNRHSVLPGIHTHQVESWTLTAFRLFSIMN